MQCYRVKDWKRFQHYNDRNPPWIRLHKDILDNFDFQCLPDASKALAPMMWLLASEHKDIKSGVIDGPDDKIAFRLRMSADKFKQSIKPLIEKKFFEILHIDSTVLATCLQVATPETDSTETDSTETEEEKTIKKEFSENFIMFFDLFPRKRRGNRDRAWSAWKTAIKRDSEENIIAGLKKYIESDEVRRGFAKGAQAWLNDDRWGHDYSKVSADGEPKLTQAERDAAVEEHRKKYYGEEKTA